MKIKEVLEFIEVAKELDKKYVGTICETIETKEIVKTISPLFALETTIDYLLKTEGFNEESEVEVKKIFYGDSLKELASILEDGQVEFFQLGIDPPPNWFYLKNVKKGMYVVKQSDGTILSMSPEVFMKDYKIFL